MSGNWDENMKNTDDKTNVQKLCSWISSNPVKTLTAQESQMTLVTLLWAIHAPHDLEQFLTITEQLPDVVSRLEDIIPSDINNILKDTGMYIDYVKLLVTHIHQNEEEIYDLLGNVIESKKSDNRHPMHNKLGKYYIYTALMTGSELGYADVDNQLNSLKAVILICHILLIRKVFPPQSYLFNNSGIKYQPNDYGREKTILACRFIRQASNDMDSDLINEVEDFSTVNELYAYLES